MRRIQQPGIGTPERIQSVECGGRAFSLRLPAGVPLLEAVRSGFAAEGFASGVVKLDGLKLAPFAYVMPALSKTPEHAAFYSETFRPKGEARIEVGAMTFGQRDGAPFFHAHALWVEGDGKRTGGHILPDETAIAETITVEAIGLDGAVFAAEPDSETHFKLFGPVVAAPGGAGQGRFFALRVKPNVDFCGALEAFCAERGIREAVIHGGVGSTIGARFVDGGVVENFATEVAITGGRVVRGADGFEAAIDVALVDYSGALAGGRLKRGDNPVLMTFELVLEAV
ncbi:MULTISPECIES: DNA-binding protein [Bosea]|uniref:DNA-binding protein n=1 Tax=Bosea TaxID=85413 RepID=UPI002150220A|nr:MULTISPECIES: DNA-binding protein [Bosea]MCR4519921.1 DNA-binding protein [Bosea sp. 47.2.35]MDR6828833.1 putative DNA-binding protein with PD1-like motif [Bosea robiniae]MDR6895753.1 putative DNA-binding protein with PD1-like motif [Bosea sp. BE109]MDR7139149.1 putative DNA-binding protein with PD1-like motif [Bosea sp. BE168]MDR7175813.1 putative DNA-binding protein with PD1-like motif [Bosea sp. BE271]